MFLGFAMWCGRRRKFLDTLTVSWWWYLEIIHNLSENVALNSTIEFFLAVLSIGCSFEFLLKVDVEESIVNAPLTTGQLFKSNLTLCVVCVFTLQTDEGVLTIDSSTLRRN
jgi:hypothetical protein